MRTAIKETLRSLERFIPIALYKKLVQRHALGVLYHVASNEELPHIAELYRYKTPSSFASDLDYLKRAWSLCSYAELSTRGGRAGARDLPLLVTTDDGMNEVFTVMSPILRAKQIPCIHFVVTGALDNRFLLYRHKVSLCLRKLREAGTRHQKEALVTMLSRKLHLETNGSVEFIAQWLKSLHPPDHGGIDECFELLGWDENRYLAERRPYLTIEQVRELSNAGFTIGAHTVSHPLLSRLQPDEVRSEIIGSVETVRELTGQKEVPFAFPFSGQGVPIQILDDVRRECLSLGLVFDTGSLAEPPRSYIVHRLICDSPVRDKAAADIRTKIRIAYGTELRRRFRDQYLR